MSLPETPTQKLPPDKIQTSPPAVQAAHNSPHSPIPFHFETHHAGVRDEHPHASALFHSLGVLSPDEVDQRCNEESNAEFLIEGFLRASSVNIVAGDSTIGKSPFVCQLALCVASGTEFLGMSVVQKRVLYFDLENPIADHRTMRDAISRYLGLHKAPPDFLVVTEAKPEKLEEQIKATKPGLVVLDSLRAFKPEVTKRNSDTGTWLKEIRTFARQHKCAFLIVHHLRKVRTESLNSQTPELDDNCRVNEWLQEMEGPRALVNQTDTRIAVAPDERGLKIKWTRRLAGDSPVLVLERKSEEGEPVGYRQLTGSEHLSLDRRLVFDALPQSFRFKDAKEVLQLTDKPTNDFLQKCVSLGILRKLPARSGYEKVPSSPK